MTSQSLASRLRARCRLLVIALLALAIPLSMARATTVSPVMVDLQTAGRGVVANISVNNTGATALPVEIVIKPLQPTATGFAPTTGSTDDLLVVPPTALIPAGQTQTFRVQWIGDPNLLDSKHYYIGVNQVPVKLPQGTSAVQVVYNFEVLTSVASPNQRPNLVLHSASAMAEPDGKIAAVISVENTGGAHGYLSQHRLRISETDKAGKSIFERTISGSEFQQLIGYGLVASHTTRSVTLPLELPTAEGTVTAVLLDQQAQ
jgi:fimbrial chaperone protein